MAETPRASPEALLAQAEREGRGRLKVYFGAAPGVGKTFAMLQAARSSNELMNGIAKDSREQASAIEEVTSAVRQMDEMTQHNAALVEEINASIEQTESQASDLDRVVDIFTLTDTHQAARPARAVAVPASARAPAPKGGIKVMQERVKQAAKSYLTRGSTALDPEWSEF